MKRDNHSRHGSGTARPDGSGKKNRFETTFLSGPGVSPRVSGILEVPEGGGPHPAVIMLHDAAGLNPKYRQLAGILAEAGFVTLALDYYAEAGSSSLYSKEKIEKWPMYRETVRGAIRYMRGLPAVSGQPAALVGFSRGAFLAVSAASQEPSVKAVVDFFGGGGGGTRSLEEEVRDLPPVLILHGEDDRIVPVRFAHELRDAVVEAGNEAEIHIYPREGHGFSGAAMSDALRRTIGFLKRHLGG